MVSRAASHAVASPSSHSQETNDYRPPRRSTDFLRSSQRLGSPCRHRVLGALFLLRNACLGDRVIGKTKAVTIGTLLMAAGHLAMASEHFFLVALLLLVVGSGC